MDKQTMPKRYELDDIEYIVEFVLPVFPLDFSIGYTAVAFKNEKDEYCSCHDTSGKFVGRSTLS